MSAHPGSAANPANVISAPASAANASRRGFLKGFAGLSAGLFAAGLSAGEQTPAQAATANGIPGAAKPWHANVPVYGGNAGLSSGNTQLVLPVCGWGGLGGGINFALVFNSQSSRVSSLGAKWTHSLNLFLSGNGPVVIMDGAGNETTYTLNSGGYTPPTGCYDVLTHNADSTWILARKGGGKYTFSSAGVLTSITDNNGLTSTLVYTNGLLTSVKDAAGRVLTLAYSGTLLVSVTDCQNKTYTLSYVNNLPTSLTTPPLSGQTYTQQISYDANGNVATLSDRLGRTWGYTYSGNVLSGTLLPGGASAGSSGGSKPVLQQQAGTSRNGGTSAISTTPGTVWPANVVSSNNWQDATGNNTQYGLDNLGRLVSIIDAASNQTVYTYDTSHNRTAMQAPDGNTWHSTFDNYGNELVAQDPLGKQVSNTYDGPSGRILSRTNANNNTTSYGYDGNGNLTSVQDGNGNTTTYGVNNLGQQNSLMDATGLQWLYGYDANGYRTTVGDPQGNITQFAFNNIGQKTQRTDSRSRITNYALDDWNRIIGVAYPTTGNASLGFSYNAQGQLTQSSDGTGLRTYQYNTLGQRTGMTDPRGNTSATYDNVGNLLTQIDVSGRQITNVLNAVGQLLSIKDGNDNATASYTYTLASQVSTATYPNGTKTSYGYDNAGRVTNLTHTNSVGSVIVGYTAQYDSGDRLIKVTEQPSGDVTVYIYDQANNLLSEVRTGGKSYSGTYTYDQNGRRLTARTITNGTIAHNGTYTYDTAGRLARVVDSATTPPATELYTWNPDGTMASYPGPVGSGYTRQMRYDEERNLTGIAHDYGNGNIQTTCEYGYAADGGRRWQKDYAAGVWTWYPCGVACNAGELVEQTSDMTGNAWTTSALYLKSGSNCGASLVRRNGEYHYFDIAGKVSIVADSHGVALASHVFDKFGVSQFSSGSAQTPWTASGNYTGADYQTVNRVCIVIAARDQSITANQAGPLQTCGGPGKPPKPDCGALLAHCDAVATGVENACLVGVTAIGIICAILCGGTGILTLPCVWKCGSLAGGLILGCTLNFQRMEADCKRDYFNCLKNQAS